jgi:hypothetical protein
MMIPIHVVVVDIGSAHCTNRRSQGLDRRCIATVAEIRHALDQPINPHYS